MNRDRETHSSEPGKPDSAGAVDTHKTEYENWVHDFRNALGNTTIAASAARVALNDESYADVLTSMRLIEDGCERCLRLLRAMPR